MQKFDLSLTRPWTLTQRRFVLLLIYAAIAIPWIARGAIRSLGSNTNSPLNWVTDDFPARQDYDQFCAAFGQGDVCVVSWEGCTLDNPALDQLVAHLRQTDAFLDEHHRSYFESVVSGRELLGSLVGAPLALDLPLAKRRLSGTLVGLDGQTTCLAITFSPAGLERRSKLVDEIQRSISSICSVPADAQHLAGPVIDGLMVDRASQKTLDQLALPSALLVLLLCYLMLGSLPVALMVFGVSLYAQGVTLAIVDYCGLEMSALLIVTPPLMQALAVAGGIHLVNYYIEAKADPHEAHPAAAALRMGWLPCFLSSFTTVIGLMSLMVSQLSPIRDFGMVSAAGLTTATGLLLTLIPGVLTIWQWSPGQRTERGWDPAPIWRRMADILERFHLPLGFLGLLVTVAVAMGIQHVRASVRIETLFATDSRVMQDYAWLEERIGPLVPLEVLIECDPSCSLNLRDRLRLIQACERELRADGSPVSSLYSPSTLMPKWPPMPDLTGAPAEMVAAAQQQYMARVDATLEQLRPFLTAAGVLREVEGRQIWRIKGQVSALEKIHYGEQLAVLRQRIAPLLVDSAGHPLAGVSMRTTGIMPLVHQIQDQLLSDLFSSFLSAFVLITLVMTILQGSVIAGLIAMIPNIFPTLLMFGGMGWLGLSMDIGSVMTASVALGIAVDDTLHFLTFFRRGTTDGMSRSQAIRFAYQHCGKAMAQTSIVLTLGMLVFALSDFLPTRCFAWMMSLSLVAALFGDLVILPGLLVSSWGEYFVDRAPTPMTTAVAIAPIPAPRPLHDHQSRPDVTAEAAPAELPVPAIPADVLDELMRHADGPLPTPLPGPHFRRPPVAPPSPAPQTIASTASPGPNPNVTQGS